MTQLLERTKCIFTMSLHIRVGGGHMQHSARNKTYFVSCTYMCAHIYLQRLKKSKSTHTHLFPEGSYAWEREKLNPKFSKPRFFLQRRLGILQLACIVCILLKPKEKKRGRFQWIPVYNPIKSLRIKLMNNYDL